MIFRFAYPAALVLALLPLLLLLLERWRNRMNVPLLVFSDVRLVDGLPSGWRVRYRRLPDVVRALAWVALVIALARPQAGRAQEIIRGQGIDIVMALDISGSMGTLDFDPQTRLQAAKQVIGSFVRERSFDRIGLVVFAREAFHQVPPTLDYDVLLRLLDEVQLAPDLMLDDGTAIGMGLASAGNMLRRSQATSRVIILLTDGANNAGSLDPITAARALHVFGMRVYTIAMGRAEPDAGGDAFARNDLDEETLQEIAALTGGVYFRATDIGVLQQVYDQINGLERSDIERQVLMRWQEQAEGWMGLALVLLVSERVLRVTVFQMLP